MATGFKSGGRKAGTPNKKTQLVRDMFIDLMSAEMPDMRKRLDEIEKPEHRMYAVQRMLAYVIPKVKPIEFDGSEPAELRETVVTMNIN